jgi:hypothetical protein
VRLQDGLLRLVILEPRGSARPTLDAWIDLVINRHASRFDRPALLKAIRALSARYVENRSGLAHGSPVDSAGKRAAFAAFYAPLHALTVHRLLGSIDTRGPRTIVDLGCGTGAASLAWAVGSDVIRQIDAIDLNRWALEEAAWNYRTMKLRARMRRASFVDVVEEFASTRTALTGTAFVAAWSVNELPDPDRDRLLPLLLPLSVRGASILVVEPLSRRATPWWNAWRAAAADFGGQAAEWKSVVALPPALADLDEAAGFRREGLGARTIWLPGASAVR